jgi:hypothetical protein
MAGPHNTIVEHIEKGMKDLSDVQHDEAVLNGEIGKTHASRTDASQGR